MKEREREKERVREREKERERERESAAVPLKGVAKRSEKDKREDRRRFMPQRSKEKKEE